MNFDTINKINDQLFLVIKGSDFAWKFYPEEDLWIGTYASRKIKWFRNDAKQWIDDLLIIGNSPKKFRKNFTTIQMILDGNMNKAMYHEDRSEYKKEPWCVVHFLLED